MMHKEFINYIISQVKISAYHPMNRTWLCEENNIITIVVLLSRAQNLINIKVQSGDLLCHPQAYSKARATIFVRFSLVLAFDQ